MSGSVTHTISTSVIVFELTGHLSHVLPCVVSSFIAFTLCVSGINSRHPDFANPTHELL